MTTSYVYQRLWKSDDFKIGARLGFDTIGNTHHMKVVLARRAPPDEIDAATRMPLTPNRRPVPWMATNTGIDDGGESVYDR